MVSSAARSPFDTRIKSTIVSAVGAVERAQMLTRDAVMLRECTDVLMAHAHLLVAERRTQGLTGRQSPAP